jgi:hypothetical protein
VLELRQRGVGGCRQDEPVPTATAEEPRELDGEREPQVGVDVLGTVRDGYGLRDEAAASRHLSIEGRRGPQENVRELVGLGKGDEGAGWGVARAYGVSGPDDRRADGGNLGPLESRPDDRLHGGTQKSVLRREAQGARVSGGGVHEQHALLRCRETYPTVLRSH